MTSDTTKNEAVTDPSGKGVKLTKATLGMLRHLWDAENMTAHFNDVWKAAGVTCRGFWTVLDRAEDAKLVRRNSVQYASFTLTFAGMTALREHYTRLYNERPCEAYRLEMEKFSRLPEGSDAA
jgi:hypothetical protein